MKYPTKEMRHPGQDMIQEIRTRGWTQKYFSLLLGKKVSEVNELIKGKRNITIQRDLILSKVLGSPEKFRMNKQIDYDYIIVKQNFDDSKLNAPDKKQPAVLKSTVGISQKMETKKITPQKESIIQKQPKQYPKESKNKEHEGIFRNF